MRVRGIAAAAVWAALTAAAMAQDVPAVPLPTLALDPAPEPSIWHGLSVGSELVVASGHGGGGVGGDVFASYDRAFSNNIVLGVRGSTGTAPGFGARSFYRGFDFAGADVRVGYDMGRVMPFLTAGFAVARPHLGAALAAPGGETLNVLMNGGGNTATLGHVGAGVEVALTNNLTFGVAVSAVQNRGPLLLP